MSQLVAQNKAKLLFFVPFIRKVNCRMKKACQHRRGKPVIFQKLRRFLEFCFPAEPLVVFQDILIVHRQAPAIKPVERQIIAGQAHKPEKQSPGKPDLAKKTQQLVKGEAERSFL